MPMAPYRLLPNAIQDRNAYHVRKRNVCCASRSDGSSRVAETFANGLAADTLFCDDARQPPPAPRTRGGYRLVEIRRTSAAAVMSLADANEQALLAPGPPTVRAAK